VALKPTLPSLNGIVITSVEIVYNPIEKRKKQKQSEDNFGPTVERTYKTQQMRGNMEKEDS
jgi:hypothetical protein